MRFRFVRYSSEQRLVLHDKERPRLLVHRTWGLNGRVDKLFQRLVFNGFSVEFAHRSPRIDSLHELHCSLRKSRTILPCIEIGTTLLLGVDLSQCWQR
jgi:hypothetical protein